MRLSYRPAFARALAAGLAAMLLTALSSCSLTPAARSLESDENIPRLVLLADPHLPFKSTLWDPAVGWALLGAKERARSDVNAWGDVARVVVLGDLTGARGTAEEYEVAAAYLARFSAPVEPITGNHDYIYEDTPGPRDGLAQGSPAERAEKLGGFAARFGLSNLQREESLAGYELVYLSSDSTDKRYQVGLSEASLRWLDETLSRTAALPTIIFYHAPLAGTLLVKGKPASGSSVAQPVAALDEVLRRHPQVFLWVSGHTHTAPTDPSFAAPINVYAGRITDVHCPDMDRTRICTNSLWLYPDHVLVRTYDHLSHSFISRLDREIPIPKR